MVHQGSSFRNLKDLKNYVYQMLCELNDFELGAFPVVESILTRSGTPCGIYFCMHGPRSVRLNAIWETERNTILFYGSTGERELKSVLVGAPSLENA